MKRSRFTTWRRRQSPNIPAMGARSLASMASVLASSPVARAKSRVEQVQGKATRWLWTCDHERPNMALGGITPMRKLALAA